MIFGKGYTDGLLTEEEIRLVVSQALSAMDFQGKRLLVIIPDNTRSTSIPLIFRLIHEAANGKAVQLDCLVAVESHTPLNETEILERLGLTPEEKAGTYRNVGFYNHLDSDPSVLSTMGMLREEEMRRLTGGLLGLDLPLRVNRMVLEHDMIILLGVVYPHEAAGFSGGTKYLFPGVSDTKMIDFIPWLGAMLTNRKVIGVKATPVREVIDRAASFIQTPRQAICLVTRGEALAGIFAGDAYAAWNQAADLSAEVNIIPVTYSHVTAFLNVSPIHQDLWTGAHGIYRVDPVIADGGEVILYAPHIKEFSLVYGNLLDNIGYHVRDFFTHQWDRYDNVPWGVLAHATLVRGTGTFINGIEKARIRVTLATGISEERCRKANLGYRDPASIDPLSFRGREVQGVLYVERAGETLYRLQE